MRVIAGSARSVPLMAPPRKNTRPTSDKIKETLFNILQFEVKDRIFLDIFAGSGAIGIEALSRGAKKCIFVDSSHQATLVIKRNLQKCHLEKKALVYNCDALKLDLYVDNYLLLKKGSIVYLDPPYGSGLEIFVLEGLIKKRCLDEDTIIILEAEKNYEISKLEKFEFLCITRIKKYKNQEHIFIRRRNSTLF